MASQQEEAKREHLELRDVLNLFFFPDMAKTNVGLIEIRKHVRYLTREHTIYTTNAYEYARGRLLAHHSNDARRRDHYQEMINLLVLRLLAMRRQV